MQIEYTHSCEWVKGFLSVGCHGFNLVPKKGLGGDEKWKSHPRQKNIFVIGFNGLSYTLYRIKFPSFPPTNIKLKLICELSL